MQSVLPLFGIRKTSASTHERIITLLSRRNPLSVMEIQVGLWKTQKLRLSYQAVRKSVFVLRGMGILEHKKDGYRISVSYLLSLRSAIDNLLQKVQGQALALPIENAPFQSFTTNSLFETDVLWGDILQDLCLKIPAKNRSHIVSINHHAWWLPLNTGREREVFSKIQRLGFSVCFIFTKNSALTRWARDLYKEFAVTTQVQPKLNIESNYYYNVLGDFVIEVIIPKGLHDKIGSVCGNEKDLSRLSSELLRISHRESTISISVFENQLLARSLMTLCKFSTDM